MPAATTDELCRRLLMELVPALIERDFSASSDALYEFGQTAGSYFKQVQGGVFADRQMERLAKRLQSEGLRGVGQTSWGPTLFALCPDQKSALQWERDLHTDPLASGCRIRIAAPMNSGADIATS
jgi:predicted sugar kinase